MSFTPTFEITGISRDSSAVTVKDTTPTGGSTGYGSTDAPTNASGVTSIALSMIPYGINVDNYLSLATGNTLATLTTALKFTGDIPDGVLLFKLRYGISNNTGGTISSDRLTITLTGAGTLFLGTTHVSLDGTILTEIASISTNSIVLVTPLPGSGSTFSILYKYYTAELRTLVLWKADKYIINSINTLSLCDNTTDIRKSILKIILREKAQTEYSLGNFSNANELALLVCGTQPAHTLTCNSCE